MRIIIAKDSSQFRKKDRKRLREIDAEFYSSLSIDDIPDLRSDREKLLAVQPAFLEGCFESLPWEKLREIRNLKALVLATTSFSWIDIENLTRQGTLVCNCPDKATNSVAEGGLFSLIALLRNIPLLIQNNFNQGGEVFMGRDLKGLKIGVVGLGRIGSRFAEICENNGCEVCYWNRTKKVSKYKFLELEELFRYCDCIYLSFATSVKLEGFISHNLIDQMGKNAILISCIDNIVYDEDYIVRKVQKREIGGFAYEKEAGETVGNVKGNILAVPDSYYYYTEETLENESGIFTDTIFSVLEKRPINLVNSDRGYKC